MIAEENPRPLSVHSLGLSQGRGCCCGPGDGLIRVRRFPAPGRSITLWPRSDWIPGIEKKNGFANSHAVSTKEQFRERPTAPYGSGAMPAIELRRSPAQHPPLPWTPSDTSP